MDLVFLHGGAAAGKLTTARALARRLHYPVFHNHLVVDLLLDLFPFGSPPFVRLREQMWLSVFGEAAQADRSLIFTFTPEPSVPFGFPARARSAVEDVGGRVCFVRLTVSDDLQESRITAAGRREFRKLNDVATLRALRSQDGDVEQPPIDLEIDTDVSDAEASAAAIVRCFGLVRRSGPSGYPDA